MLTYACLRDTHSSSSHYLTHNGNDLCLENKDAITQNHSYALSLWHQRTTHPCSDAYGRLDTWKYKQQRAQKRWLAERKRLCYSLSSSVNYRKISFSGFVTLSKYYSVATDV